MNLLDDKINSLYKLCKHISDQQQKNSLLIQRLSAIDKLLKDFWNNEKNPKICETHNELFKNNGFLTKITITAFKSYYVKDSPTMHSAYISNLQYHFEFEFLMKNTDLTDVKFIGMLADAENNTYKDLNFSVFQFHRFICINRTFTNSLFIDSQSFEVFERVGNSAAGFSCYLKKWEFDRERWKSAICFEVTNFSNTITHRIIKFQQPISSDVLEMLDVCIRFSFGFFVILALI
ncbi:hypothetical protein GLOIN_2v1870636 [Rhizophagus clarus]|uniref:Uncharacterized protein n=1 Tax=Rhizophagus clarus TaxID=94130 RepID=A0A8H3QXR7_9GLOM|nr:hypothetical protein GLOIN_2v1870636 [Rhizophagus clarus]